MTEKSLSEQFKERLDLRPDKYTLAWWDKQFDEYRDAYRGLNHLVNRVTGNTLENRSDIKELQAKNAELDRENMAMMARVGELQSELAKVNERLDLFAEWAKKQKGTS